MTAEEKTAGSFEGNAQASVASNAPPFFGPGGMPIPEQMEEMAEQMSNAIQNGGYPGLPPGFLPPQGFQVNFRNGSATIHHSPFPPGMPLPPTMPAGLEVPAPSEAVMKKIKSVLDRFSGHTC